MSGERRFLEETLLACCKRLEGVEAVPFMYLDDVGRVCATLRPLVADAATPDELALQRLVWTTEEVVLDWALSGVCAGAGLPDWVMGDVAGDYASWRSALEELAELRGQADA